MSGSCVGGTLFSGKSIENDLMDGRGATRGFQGLVCQQLASGLGSLVEAVNILGSLFYGTMLGVFLIAFYMKWISGTPVFIGAVVSEIVIFALFLCERLGLFTLSWLWYPVAGCSIVILVAVMFQSAVSKTPTHEHHD